LGEGVDRGPTGGGIDERLAVGSGLGEGAELSAALIPWLERPL
jgi:hypothetical protein